jgi:hypothetical protein
MYLESYSAPQFIRSPFLASCSKFGWRFSIAFMVTLRVDAFKFETESVRNAKGKSYFNMFPALLTKQFRKTKI